MARLVRLFALLLASVLAVPLLASVPVQAAAGAALSPADEKAYIANINTIRAANGLEPLTLDKNMRAAAREWTEWMADNTTLQHADDIVTGAPSDWLKVGENVGRGGSLESVWEAFLASPSHRANLLDPAYDLVGVGVMWTEDGRIYTTHRFASTESGGQAADEEEEEATPTPTAPDPELPPTPTPPPEPTPLAPNPAPAPDRLPFAGPEPVTPPADPDRVSLTITLLLSAGRG